VATLLGLLVLVVWLTLNTALRARLPPELQWLVAGSLHRRSSQADRRPRSHLLRLRRCLLVSMGPVQRPDLDLAGHLRPDGQTLVRLSRLGARLQLPGALRSAAAAITAANALLILILVPIFTFFVYPVMGRFFKVTPLRKIGIGLFVIAASYLIVAWIEDRIMHGVMVSLCGRFSPMWC